LLGIRASEQEDRWQSAVAFASNAWEPGSVPGTESKWKRLAMAGMGAFFGEDVGDDQVDYFVAGDLDEAGDESSPRLGALAAVDD
jgi:hypothetical protein